MNITIRKFEEKDIENKIKWINDNKNNQYLHYDLPLEYKKTLNWFNKNKDRIDRYDAVIDVDGISVGLTGLLSINKNNNKAEYYILIGDQEYKGKGIAKIGTRLLLDYAFKELNLNKIYLFTETGNLKAQRLFESIGFRKEGLLKEDIKNGDILVDRYAYGVCKNDYYFKNNNKEEFIFNTTIIQKLNDGLNDNNLYIKREDLLPLSFGGNKARKAMLFFEDIEKNHSNCIVTYGSSSSNHCRIIANMGAQKGLPCYIISPQENKGQTSNRKMMDLFGAVIISCPIDKVKETIDRTIKELKYKGYRPYFIQGGGHGNIGTQAYVNTYKEIKDYEEKNNIEFDYIFHASGTGTTQAGLICGKILNNDDKEVIGISIARKNPYGKEVIIDSINYYMSSIGKNKINSNEINFIDDYILDGYGSYNTNIIKTIKRVLVQEGIPLDITYTGKAFWGMEDYIIKNSIKGKNILFLHTGGTPLFFDDLEVLMND